MTSDTIHQLIVEFTSKTLPKSQWTHEAHLIVAFWYNWHFSFVEAFEQVKQGIIDYNEAVGTLNSDTSGYHESLTMFWMIWTKNYITKNQYKTLVDACSSFFKNKDALSTLPLQYYTKNVLFSIAARKTWINGDIKQIELLK